MKKSMIFLLVAGVFSFAACGQSQTQQTNAEEQVEKVDGVQQNSVGGYGKVIQAKNPVELSALMSDLSKADGFQGQVTGTVVASCQNKGCWMTLDGGNGQTMMVSFKDYGFFVPKDFAGKKVVIEGNAAIKTVSVEDQRHLASDAGKSEEEIKMITEEKRELSFVADGVIVL
jgi:hypothetical protein